ncbi:MAG TPA: phosphoribosylformylglycinamidine synthase subunit PurS [bacterium]|nr:phosphoribosylformylglycinamidine synthase subunit PurS [bacterium]
MATIRIIVTLKPGVLDAQGQAVRRGLRALGYGAVQDVKMGRYIELTIPDAYPQEEIHQMCDRLLANPLIEEWRLESSRPNGDRTRSRAEARSPKPEARGLH